MYNLKYFTKKGFEMNVTTSKKILNEAINSGCKTAAELALYLRVRTNMQTVKVSQ